MKKKTINTKTSLLAVIILVMFFTPKLIFANTVILTESGLGLPHGNYGQYLVVDDLVRISALTHIGQADASAGTVCLDKGDKGFGVQNYYEEGSKGISGSGGDQDEALVLEFLAETIATSIVIGLTDYNSRDDDPIISLICTDGSEFAFTESHQNWGSAVSSLGGGKITVSMDVLLGQGFNGIASGVSVTEVTGHLYVNSLASNPVPEPATVCLLGLGTLLFRKRKNKNQI